MNDWLTKKRFGVLKKKFEKCDKFYPARFASFFHNFYIGGQVTAPHKCVRVNQTPWGTDTNKQMLPPSVFQEKKLTGCLTLSSSRPLLDLWITCSNKWWFISYCYERIANWTDKIFWFCFFLVELFRCTDLEYCVVLGFSNVYEFSLQQKKKTMSLANLWTLVYSISSFIHVKEMFC